MIEFKIYSEYFLMKETDLISFLKINYSYDYIIYFYFFWFMDCISALAIGRPFTTYKPFLCYI